MPGARGALVAAGVAAQGLAYLPADRVDRVECRPRLLKNHFH